MIRALARPGAIAASMPRFPAPAGPDHAVPGNALPVQRERWPRGAWLFRDETLRSIEFILDELFRVPGTRLRFGVDGVVGLVPGVGDVLAGILSLVIPLAAWIRGVPFVALLRMTVNLAIGVLVGSIPVAGDIFDVFWKANRRNLALLNRHLRAPRRHTWRDWAFLALLAFGLAAVFAIPLLLVAWLAIWLIRR